MNTKKLRVKTAVLIFSVFLSACNGFISETEDYTDSGDGASENSDDTVSDTSAENTADHDESSDYTWSSSEIVSIALNGSSFSTSSSNVSVSGSTATIKKAGTYSLSGTLSNGQIFVDTDDEEIVRLILNNANISSSTGAAIYIENSEKTMIVLAENTNNSLSDGTTHNDDESNAALFSKSDLTIYGDGSLTVKGNYNDGIASKDGLIIASGTITVTAVDDGIRGKDYLVVKNGNITINAGDDGMKSDNDSDSSLGYISFDNGSFNITATGDAITAQTDVLISYGEFKLTAGGGSSKTVASTASAKGIKAAVCVTIDDGVFTINSADDAIHSNDYLVINLGTFSIASGDDGIHADNSLGINGGKIDITKSYEGIESAEISITGGDIQLVASDDGLNVASGVDGSGMGGWGGYSSSGNYYLYMDGGYIYINATGDGVDVNGSVVMTDGTIIVDGPTSSGNGALDYDGTFKISGGYILALGSSGMAMAPSTSSTQYSILVNLSSSKTAGTLIHLQDGSGNEVFTFSPAKTYQSVAFSSPVLTKGKSYELYTSGSYSGGSKNNGLCTGGTYSSGTQYTSFTISSIVTSLGSSGSSNPGH